METDGYRFELTCPLDGAPIRSLATGVTTGEMARAIAKCTECDVELMVEATVTPARPGQRLRSKYAGEAGQ